MKFLERLSLNLFSAVTLLLSAIVIMTVGSFLKPDFLTIQMQNLLANPLASKIAVGVSVVFILLALKNLLFGKSSSQEGKDGILLENGNGKLLISRESLENIVNSVTRDFEGTENVSSRIALDKDKNLRVYITTDVGQNIVIKELSNGIQGLVKEAIKNSIDLEVKEVNIKIRNINSKSGYKNKNVQSAEKTVAEKVEEPEVLENKEEK